MTMINAVNEFLDDLRGGRMSEAPIVSVEQGQLQGKLVSSPAGKGYFAFQGIPYAKPPLGSLRFKDPQPHEPWEGIRDATTEGNIAPQKDMIFAIKSYEGDENCLYLNIYTPTLDGAFLPVMFYVHGGGLLSGSGNTDYYGPDYLVEKDVVVVTINYRLGPLGFLCLNTPEVPGNAGLKDVILALRWVKENIHNFGGNAGNLTVFGESAGGGITSMLTASPIAKNLFSRAIVQSGTAFIDMMSQKKPIDNARALAKILGCESENVDEILEFLRSTPATDIIEANSSLSNLDGMLKSEFKFFSIVAEKEFPGVEAAAPEGFLDVLTSGRVAQVPIMVGSTTLEMGLLKKPDDLQFFIPFELNIERDSETSLAIAEELKNLYFKDDPEDISYAQLWSDRSINVGTHRYIQYLLQSSNIPVYFYKFDYVGSLNYRNEFSSAGIKDKAMHLDELGYLFKNDLQKDVDPTPEDLKVRERMVRLWTNFAKTGNPTPEINHHITVNWPPVTKDEESYLLIGNELTVGVNYDKEKMDYWDQLYNKHFKIWEQEKQERKDPVIIETLTVISSNEGTVVVETTEVTTESEISTQMVDSPQLVELKVVDSEPVVELKVVDSEPVVELNVVSEPVVESNVTSEPEVESNVVSEPVVELNVVDSAPVVESKETSKLVEKFESSQIENGFKPHVNGNGVDKKVRTSNEIKMVQSSNGTPKDVIRANDPPEDDLPKNIGVNKFVNFFESLGGKK